MKLYSASTDTDGVRYFGILRDAIKFVEQSGTMNGDVSIVDVKVNAPTVMRLLNGDGGFVEWADEIALYEAGQWNVKNFTYWTRRK